MTCLCLSVDSKLLEGQDLGQRHDCHILPLGPTEPVINVVVALPTRRQSLQILGDPVGDDKLYRFPFQDFRFQDDKSGSLQSLLFEALASSRILTQLSKKHLCVFVLYLDPKLFLSSMGFCYLCFLL